MSEETKWIESGLSGRVIENILKAVRENVKLDMLCAFEHNAYYNEHEHCETIVIRPALTDLSGTGLIPPKQGPTAPDDVEDDDEEDDDQLMVGHIRTFDIKGLMSDLDGDEVMVREFAYNNIDPQTSTEEPCFEIYAVVDKDLDEWSRLEIYIFDEPFDELEVHAPDYENVPYGIRVVPAPDEVEPEANLPIN